MLVEPKTRLVRHAQQASVAYSISWLVAAALGSVYICWAASWPNLVGTKVQLVHQQRQQATDISQSSDITEGLLMVRKWMHELQRELASANSNLQ